VTVTVYVAGGDPIATVNPEATKVPPLIVQVSFEIMLKELLVTVHDVSVVKNPPPLIWTIVSTGPDVTESVIAGAALTFARKAFSAVTNTAMIIKSKVTAYRILRKAFNLCTSLKIVD